MVWLASRPMSQLIGLTYVNAPECLMSHQKCETFDRKTEGRDFNVKIQKYSLFDIDLTREKLTINRGKQLHGDYNSKPASMAADCC